MIAYDFKLDSNEDIYIDPVTLDFVIAPSDNQHIKDIMQSAPGWYKEFPLVGLNAYKYLNGKVSVQELSKEMKIQLALDGYTVGPGGISLELTPEGTLYPKVIDAKRD